MSDILPRVNGQSTKKVNDVVAAQRRLVVSAHDPRIAAVIVLDVEDFHIVWAEAKLFSLHLATVWEPCLSKISVDFLIHLTLVVQ